MPLSVQARDVLRIWDRNTKPKKHKIHICVCPDRQLFLRINSNPVFRPAHPISKTANRFLHHDSYVELQQLIFHTNENIRNADHIGRLSKSEAKSLIEAAQKANTLTPEQRQIIIDNLLSD
jgi:hypothetical protein